MSAIKVIQNGPNSWDVYAANRDAFLAEIEFTDFNLDKNSCRIEVSFGGQVSSIDEQVAIYNHFATEAIFNRKLFELKSSVFLTDTSALQAFESAGFLSGREFGAGAKRARRFTCDRYDLVRNIAEGLMAEHLDLNIWSFGFDSAKKRLGVCKYEEHLISLSRYFVDLHSLEEIDQVVRHEIAHALAGSKAGHGPKWKKIATEIGYNHKRISGDEIGNATAKLIGNCPNGHTVYRHRKPKTPLSCSKCAPRFDRSYLITWTER